MTDILDQMRITLENDEEVFLPGLIEKAEKDGKREEYVATRLNVLKNLGNVKNIRPGPIALKSISIKKGD